MTSTPHHPPAATRTVVITGGNGGLGYECARALLADPTWRVVLACRDLGRARGVVDKLREVAAGVSGGAGSRVEAMLLDLGAIHSVRDFAGKLALRLQAGELPPLHGLVCNAGVQAGATKTFTADGFESTFGINHLGHFLLTNLLLPSLAVPARILVVASGVHDPLQKTGVPAPAWNDPVALSKGDLGPAAAKDSPVAGGQRRYSTSKLANLYFTYELARRLPAGVTVNAFDPGLMPGTGMVRDGSAPLRFLWHHVLPRILPLIRIVLLANTHTPAESGSALASLLLDPALEGRSGEYFEGRRAIPSSAESRDLACAAELWRSSVTLTSHERGVPQSFSRTA